MTQFEKLLFDFLCLAVEDASVYGYDGKCVDLTTYITQEVADDLARHFRAKGLSVAFMDDGLTNYICISTEPIVWNREYRKEFIPLDVQMDLTDVSR